MEIVSTKYFAITDNRESEIAESDLNNILQDSTAYALVTFDNNGSCKTYFSSLGGIAIVEYDHKLELAQIKAIHSEFYSSYKFRVYKPVSISADQQVYELWFFSNDGTLTSLTVNHEAGSMLLKEEYFNADKQFTGGQRFAYQDDEMRYAFEYNAKGELFNCFDIDNGDPIRLNDIHDIENKEAFRSFGEITAPSALL